MSDDNERYRSVGRSLGNLATEMNIDRYMLMEYLGPIVDGCRSALSISVEKARNLHKMSESEFQEFIQSGGSSFVDLSICFKTDDSDEIYSIVFTGGRVKVYDECVEPDVIIISDLETLVNLLDSDSSISPPDLLGDSLKVIGSNSKEIVEALGFLCYPSLLRMARSGIDPSSLLAEDADALIIAAASDMVTRMVRRWIDISLDAESG